MRRLRRGRAMSIPISSAELPLLSSSMRTMWRNCPRKVFYRYMAAIEPRRAPRPLVVGTALHRGIEAWRRSPEIRRMPAMAAQIGWDQFRIEAAARGLPDDGYTGAQVAAYVAGYLLRFGAIDKGTELVECQVFGDAEGADGETGYCDALVRYPDGQLWIVDDKTSTAWHDEETLALSLKLDDQLASYVAGLTQKGIAVAGARMRQIRKTQTRPNKNESHEQYAERVMDIYTDNETLYRELVVEFEAPELGRAAAQRERDNLAILSHLDIPDIERWPYNPSSCRGAYGPCEFIELCTLGRDRAEPRFKPKSKGPLDGGAYQRQIWPGQQQSPAAAAAAKPEPPSLSPAAKARRSPAR
jgi:hypothetical protein